MSVERKQVGEVSQWKVAPDKHWVSVALAIAAGVIGFSGHDGWGWCLFLIFFDRVLK